MRKVLVTGGSGFVGSNFIRYALERHPDWRVVNLDKLTYAGNPENLQDIEGHPNYKFVRGDIADRPLVNRIFEEGVDWVVNFAAESHVDRSIQDPSVFLRTNVFGTHVLLDAARDHWRDSARVDLTRKRFLQISTDEVYGSLGLTGKFTEESPLAPNSPYSASKAAADLLVRSYAHTYGLPVIITRCSNNYGPYQFPEKLIPLMIGNALKELPLPVYGDGLNVRDWIHVHDHCRGIDVALHQARPGETYNIGANHERTNLEVVRTILSALGKPESLIRFVPDRPGHDRRYAVDATKIKTECAWAPERSFEDGITNTIDWYVSNRGWWERARARQELR